MDEVENGSQSKSANSEKPEIRKQIDDPRCLEHEVNTRASVGDTSLHVAAGRGHVHLTNEDGDTPLLVQKTGFTENLENDDVLPGKYRSQSSSTCHKTVNNNLENSAPPELKYSKRTGRSGVSGQLYETKLLSLLLIRVLKDEKIEHFLLGTNISGIGALDDICLRYKVKGERRPVVLFVQAKHKEDCEKRRLSVKDVRSASGDFSLQKYLASYNRIKNRFRFNSLDPMFKGIFQDIDCHFIIYTPLKENFTKKKTEPQLNERAHHLINTRENTKGFQYDYDDNDLDSLPEIIAFERLRKVGIAFLELFMTKSDKSQILVNKMIARHHVIMAREVLQPCEMQEAGGNHRFWQFRPSFFESKAEYLIDLKMTFIREFSTKRFDKSIFTLDDLDNCMAALHDPCASNLSKIIGKLVLYDGITKRLHLLRVSLFKIKFSKRKFKELQKQFNEIIIHETVVNEAVQIKLTSLNIKIPTAFGNLDMTFRGSETKKLRRMRALADKLFYLFEASKANKIVKIYTYNVGPERAIQRGFIGINGGIGSAVGNLLIMDTNTKMLKFDLTNKYLPENAALFLKELKADRYKPINEDLSSFRIQINVEEFPKDSFMGDELDKEEVRMFTSKLWFYTNQAQEDEIERILKNHINTYYNCEVEPNNPLFEIHTNAIFLKCHDKTQKWWMEKDETSYLSRANDIFGGAKLECINTFLLAVIGYMPYFNISSVDFKFNQRMNKNRMGVSIRETFKQIFGKLFDISDALNSISIKVKEEIMNLLQNLENSVRDKVSLSSKLQNIRYIIQNNTQIVLPRYRFQYIKRSGTSGMRGQLYRTKLLCLVYMRALNDKQIENFLLGTTIFGFDYMDDICLRYQVRGQDRPVVLFVQAKHRVNPEKRRLTVETIRSTCIDFTIWKYFESYLTIKDQFWVNSKDPMFEGAFNDVECNLIIYTTLMNDFTEKKNDGKLSAKVYDLLNTVHKPSENIKVFQYNYVEADIDYFTDVTAIERLENLGTYFLESIITDKADAIMNNKLITRYHVVMAREVLQPCKMQQASEKYRIWQFRPQFFESDCKYFSTLKHTFIRELQTKIYDGSNITNEDIDNWKEVLQDPCASTVSKIIGKLATYNNKTKRLQLELELSAFKGKLKKNEFEALLERFSKISFYENTICDAVRIKLNALQIKLPMAFGNLDMTFRGTEQKIHRRIKAVADMLINLLKVNIKTKIVDINDTIVGPRKIISKGILDVNGGIGGAVGNLLIVDTDTNLLKFDLDNKALPHNAALFLKQLKDAEYMPVNEKLDEYRFKINIERFPKHTIYVNEFDKEQAKDFFNKLWFFTNQAKENEVEQILKDEIHKYYNNELNHCFNMYRNISNAVFLKVHDEIQKWWMQVGESHYLSRANEHFKRAERADFDNLLLTVINSMHVSSIYSMNINIKESTTDDSKFAQMQQTFNSMSNRLFQIFDSEFDESIDITLPADFERCFGDLGCPAVEFSLEIHPEMEWVTFKLMAKWSESKSYFVIATAGRGGGRGRPRDGFLLRQDFNGRSNYFLNRRKDYLAQTKL